MAVTLGVGFQQKLGLPDFGSVGASCHVEFELDSALLRDDLAGFHEQVHKAFVACRQAVADQLARPPATLPVRAAPSNPNGSPDRNGHAASNGQSEREPPTNGHPASGRRNRLPAATASQVRALWAIANRRRIDLPGLLGPRFGVDRPDRLSIADASKLIDDLKAQQDGGPA